MMARRISLPLLACQLSLTSATFAQDASISLNWQELSDTNFLVTSPDVAEDLRVCYSDPHDARADSMAYDLDTSGKTEQLFVRLHCMLFGQFGWPYYVFSRAKGSASYKKIGEGISGESKDIAVSTTEMREGWKTFYSYYDSSDGPICRKYEWQGRGYETNPSKACP